LFQVVFVIASVTGKYIDRVDPPIAIPGNLNRLVVFVDQSGKLNLNKEIVLEHVIFFHVRKKIISTFA